jgi:ankyrin repeat protein
MKRLLLGATALLVLACVAAALYLWSCIRASERDKSLIVAVDGNDVAAVRSLLAEGANANARAGAGRIEGPLDLIRFWQDNFPKGTDVFTVAVRNDRWAIAELLLEHGADIDGGVGVDALHAAANCGWLGLATTLLDRGVAVDAPDYDGRSPLVMAFLAKRSEMISLLLDRGADLKNVLRVYKSVYNPDEPKARAIDVYSDLYWDGPTVRALLRHGLPVGTRFVHGERPLLTVAVLAGDRETVAKLIEWGADMHAKDSLGWTALYYAEFQSRKEIAALLQRAGAKKDW